MSKKSKSELESLSNSQIRSALEDLNGLVVKLGLAVNAFEKILLKKAYVTKPEIAAAIEEVAAEAKEALAKIHAASRRGPSGTIQ